MKKILLILFIILMTVSPISAKTLQGGVEYTEAQIKQMAFDGVKKKLPRKMIKANQIDPFFDENKALIEKGIDKTDDRYILFHDDGWYSIIYISNEVFWYTYDSIGKLVYITWLFENHSYPKKWLVYYSNGALGFIALHMNKHEKYLYTSEGNLIKHFKN